MSWKVAYKNLYGELESEVFDTRDQADSRYDELSRRCDLYWSTLRDGEDIPDTCDIDWVDEPEEVDEDGSSACALGAIPTGTFEKPRKDMKLKENEEFWIDVAAPEYRGAPAPKFNPKAINEPRIPDGMRYKEYTWSEDEFTDGGVILDWVTQETYTPEDREAFKAEVKRALKENGFKGKVQVNLNVRGEDDIETFVIDMGRNESKMVIKVREGRMKESTALTSYVIVAASGKYKDSDGREGTLYDASTIVTSREFATPKELVDYIFRKLKINPRNCTVSERDSSGEYCMEIVYRTKVTEQSYIVYIQGYEKREMSCDKVAFEFAPVLKEG